MSSRPAVVAGAIAAAGAVSATLAFAVVASASEEPAARTVAETRQAQLGPLTQVEAMAAAASAGPAFRAQLSAAQDEALAERYTPAYAKDYARDYMKKRYGWGSSQYHALLSLWNRESGWDYTAENPTSGAYGIPQSLPAAKMASEGKDWRSNPEPQIRWGLKYIKSTYGSPSATVAFWDSNGWY